MVGKRRDTRNEYISLGQVFIAGELLDFVSFNISATGILVEVMPGTFLTTVEDFEKLIRENSTVEFFVKDLMFTGEATIVRVFEQNEAIHLGLEFRDVLYNATRLWHKRRYYRKQRTIPGIMIINDFVEILFETIDISIGGVMLKIVDNNAEAARDSASVNLTAGQVVKVIIKELNLKAIAEIVWIDNGSIQQLGLKYLQKEEGLPSAL